jgi:hypothetical protein
MVQVYGKVAEVMVGFLTTALRPGRPLRRNTQLLYVVRRQTGGGVRKHN